MNAVPAQTTLDAFFPEARCKLLDLAAILDRIDRGGGSADPRLAKIAEALNVLLAGGDARAERVQQVFSLAYDAQWERPTPRT